MFYNIIGPLENTSDPINPLHDSYKPMEADHTLLIAIAIMTLILFLAFR